MKKVTYAILMFAVMSNVVFAEENLPKSEGTSVGFYGGPAVKVSGVDKQAAIMLGGRGAVIFSNTFIVGGGGYVLSTPITKEITDGLYTIDFGYGGLELGITAGADWPLHFTSNLMLGAGNVNYEGSLGNNSLLFVIEPHGYLEINVVKWMRICIGGGYRFVFGVAGIRELTSRELWSPCGELLLKFGSF